MPLTIITLRNSTPSLRGDLSKWMQEIATGVYVGNFNSRIREYLWKRVIKNVGNGEATLSYASRNELGYSFETHNAKREVINFEGIPLVMFPKSQENAEPNNNKLGFSKASKYRKQRRFSRNPNVAKVQKVDYIVVDIETDGLDETNNSILEIGAIKSVSGKTEEFHKLIKYDLDLPESIVKLTGITNALLDEEGDDLIISLEEFIEFIGDNIIVGYYINFDIKFINFALKRVGKNTISNKTIDLLPIVKKENMYLSNYKLETVLEAYGDNGKVIHRALADARQIYNLSRKLKKFEQLLNREGVITGDF